MEILATDDVLVAHCLLVANRPALGHLPLRYRVELLKCSGDRIGQSQGAEIGR